MRLNSALLCPKLQCSFHEQLANGLSASNWRTGMMSIQLVGSVKNGAAWVFLLSLQLQHSRQATSNENKIFLLENHQPWVSFHLMHHLNQRQLNDLNCNAHCRFPPMTWRFLWMSAPNTDEETWICRARPQMITSIPVVGVGSWIYSSCHHNNIDQILASTLLNVKVFPCGRNYEEKLIRELYLNLYNRVVFLFCN